MEKVNESEGPYESKGSCIKDGTEHCENCHMEIAKGTITNLAVNAKDNVHIYKCNVCGNVIKHEIKNKGE